jgi:hypothetical protein
MLTEGRNARMTEDLLATRLAFFPAADEAKQSAA